MLSSLEGAILVVLAGYVCCQSLRGKLDEKQ